MFKVWYRDLIVWSRYMGSSLVASLGEPLLYLMALGFGLGRYVSDFGGSSYPEFIAPAIVVVGLMNSVCFETTFSSYTRMAVQKTFDAIAVTPVSFREVILGEILWATTKGCISSVLILIVLKFFGLIPSFWALGVLLLCFVAGVAFASLGMLATSFAKSYEMFSYFFTLLVSPMFLFSGTFFPLDTSPAWLQRLAWFLPLTHAVNGAREIFAGHLGLKFWGAFLWLSVAAILFTFYAVRRMERRLFV